MDINIKVTVDNEAVKAINGFTEVLKGLTGIMPNAAGWMFPRQAAKGGAHFAADPRITNHARHGRRRHGNLCHECLPCRGPQPGTV